MQPNARFDALAKEFFRDMCDLDPCNATFLGLKAYYGRLPDSSEAGRQKMLATWRRYQTAFQKFPARGLSADRTVDRELALYQLRLWLFSELSCDTTRRNPQGPANLGFLLFHHFVRSQDPMPERLEVIADLLEAAPKYLRRSQETLVRPERIWVEVALESADGLPGFLAVIEAAAKKELPARRFDRFHKANMAFKETLGTYLAWLHQDALPKSTNAFAIGPKKFSQLLKLRRLDMSAGELVRFGRRQLKAYDQELAGLAAQIRRGSTVAEVRAFLKSRHPQTFEGVLLEVQKATSQARGFIRSKGFATLPPGETLQVVPTPDFMSNLIPFGAYIQPGKFEKEQRGTYLVTPLPDGSERLDEHNTASVSVMSVHEAYPGHHLQLCCANTNPSLIRVLVGAAIEFVEGWAHYCEEAMRDLGFNRTPEWRFMQVIDMKWRAARIVADVLLSTGKMSYDEAVAFMQEQSGMDENSAQAEVKRYTSTPGYQLSYLVGKHLILDLKARVKKQMGDRYTDRFFHDVLLYGGSMPLVFHRKAMEARVRERLKEDAA